MSDGYTILSLDELETAPGALGFRAAAVSACKADTGGSLIPQREGTNGREELYVVVHGRATFTVGGEAADARAGTLVFAPPEAHRAALAEEDGTAVFAVGGTVGEPHRE